MSVVVCAYTEDRYNDLTAAVESLFAQSAAPLEVIVIVDHNPQLHRRVRSTMTSVVALENSDVRGLSGTRNTGIEVANGDVIAFLDDDAIAAPDWLEQLLKAFADPRVLGVGGTVHPLWPSRRPPGLPSEFDWVVGCTYLGLPVDTSPVRNMIGANMAFRRTVFEAVGGFSTDVGRVGTRPSGCEETELCIRARQRIPDGEMIFEPRALVHHRVTRERTRWRYFRSRCFAEGLSKAIVARHSGREDGLAAERAYVTGALPRGFVRGLSDAILRRDGHGIVRASAILLGLGYTATGYAVGTAKAKFV